MFHSGGPKPEKNGLDFFSEKTPAIQAILRLLLEIIQKEKLLDLLLQPQDINAQAEAYARCRHSQALQKENQENLLRHINDNTVMLNFQISSLIDQLKLKPNNTRINELYAIESLANKIKQKLPNVSDISSDMDELNFANQTLKSMLQKIEGEIKTEEIKNPNIMQSSTSADKLGQISLGHEIQQKQLQDLLWQQGLKLQKKGESLQNQKLSGKLTGHGVLVQKKLQIMQRCQQRLWQEALQLEQLWQQQLLQPRPHQVCPQALELDELWRQARELNNQLKNL